MNNKGNINIKLLIIGLNENKKLSKNAIILKDITPKIPYSENVPSVLNFKKYLLKMQPAEVTADKRIRLIIKI